MGRVKALLGAADTLPDWEQTVIITEAQAFGIDARLLAALRLTENGGPGREFGVLSVPAETYGEQAEIAARTIRNTLQRYRAHVGKEPLGEDGRVTEDFLLYFSSGGPGYPGYAPTGPGVDNDPRQLNRFHFDNLRTLYAQTDVAVA